MKKLTVLLFSLIFSFNSYAQWIWSTIDVNGDPEDMVGKLVDGEAVFNT